MRLKRRNRLLLALLTLALSIAFATHISVDLLGVFELDGNVEDPGGGGDDWITLNPPPGPIVTGTTGGLAGASTTRTFIADLKPITIFTGGHSKDFYLIQGNWKHKDGSVPPKDEINHAYAAAYNVADTMGSSDTVLVFGSDRASTSGSANIGIWFFRNNVAPAADGTFVGEHAVGDIFIISEFTIGCKVSTIRVFEWNPALADQPEGNLNLLFETSDATCGTGAPKPACAIVNSAPTVSDWGGTLPPGALFEGAINLDALNISGCFTSVLFETRSSHEVNAVLKDFAGGVFNLCEVDITKRCAGARVNAAGTGILYDFAGTVTNSGGGTLYNVEVVDTLPDGTMETIQVAGTLAPMASVNWSRNNFLSTSGSVINSAEARAAFENGGAKTVLSDPDAQVTCELSPVAALRVTKACTASLFDQGAQVVVKVDFSGQVCNEGLTQLTGVTLADDPVATITPNAVTLAPGACSGYSGSYFPADIALNGDIPGRYFFKDQVSITAATATIGQPPPLASAPCPANTFGCAVTSCPICPAGTCAAPAQ